MLVQTILGSSLLIYFREPTQLLQSYLVSHPQKTEHHFLAHLLTADKNLPWRVVSGSIWRAFHNQALSNSLLQHSLGLPKVICSFHDTQNDQTFTVVWNSSSPLSCCSQQACFPAAPGDTKCCFVSRLLAFSVQSLSDQFLPWTAMFPESHCPTTLYPLQCFVECVLTLSSLKFLLIIKSLCCT